MIETIYLESSIKEHPRVKQICSRFSQARVIECERYGEVFNPKAQNFRLQKVKPALILAEKYNRRVLEAPLGYGIGGQKNYYFSHMLNCLYDCRYCFLQGMYQSAHYVLFINYEDFQQDISDICSQHNQESVYFFSGYDCDSLAMEPVTEFAKEFLPFFSALSNAWLELRTKSTQIRSLLNLNPWNRCIVAFSLSPEPVAEKVESKTPSLGKRLEAIAKLQSHGWQIGLRFDPLIYTKNFEQYYAEFFRQVFATVNLDQLHSVSLGVFRLPESYFKKIHKLYPDAKILSGPLENQKGVMSYRVDLEQQLMGFCSEQIAQFVPDDLVFPCQT